MSSPYPGGGPDYYGGGGGGGRSMASSIGNNGMMPNNPINRPAANNNNTTTATTMNHHHQQHQHDQALLRLQQQRQRLHQHQHQHQSIGGAILNDPTATAQIGNRRLDSIGKRPFADFSQISPLHPQQTHPQYSLLQQPRQQPNNPSLQQQQLYLRSVKQRTNNNYINYNTLLTPTYYPNHGPSISSVDLAPSPLRQEIPSFSSVSSPAASASARYGVPVYQQRRPPNPRIHDSDCGNNGPSLVDNTRGANSAGARNQNLGDSGSIGCSNLSSGPTSEEELMPESGGGGKYKIMDTLQELEKQLLDDNDEEEGDAVSVITNSEWSETFQNLMSPAQTATPIQAQNPNPSPSQNVISLSPTSSTSSSCSSSASPPAAAVPLRQLISEAAAAISDGKADPAAEALSRLSQMGNPKGNSEQRLVAYMASALRSRACPQEYPPPPVMELFGKEHMGSMDMLRDLSLCHRFGLCAANMNILEAVAIAQQEESRVHVIDFDMESGGQYMNLLGALGERGLQSLKITAVTTELGNISRAMDGGGAEIVNEGLLKTAERAGVSLRLRTVTQRIRALTPESLGCEEGETVVVNFAFKLHRVPDESVSMENLRDELLRRVKGLRPRVVTLVEQEMNGNTTPFATRVKECVAHYGALLESLESGATRENPERGRVEDGLGRKMANSVACEGRDRVERCEVYGKWRARMGMAGFELKPLTQGVVESMRTKTESSRVGEPKFTVKEENGVMCFGWMGRVLTVASAWR